MVREKGEVAVRIAITVAEGEIFAVGDEALSVSLIGFAFWQDSQQKIKLLRSSILWTGVALEVVQAQTQHLFLVVSQLLDHGVRLGAVRLLDPKQNLASVLEDGVDVSLIHAFPYG